MVADILMEAEDYLSEDEFPLVETQRPVPSGFRVSCQGFTFTGVEYG